MNDVWQGLHRAGGLCKAPGRSCVRTRCHKTAGAVFCNDGRNTVTLFTDPRRATQMFGDDTRIIAMKGRNLLDILKDAVVLLNPAGGKGLLMNPEQIKEVLGHAPIQSEHAVRPSGTVELADVPEPLHPVALMGRIRQAFQSLDVDAAWLSRARWMEAQQMGWHLDVRTNETPDNVRALIERAVRGLAFGGEVFDVAVSKPGGDKGVGIKLA